MAKKPAAKKPRASGARRRHRGARRTAVRASSSSSIPTTLQALELLAANSMKDLQELADEAFRDLLKKHGRPT